LKGNFNLKKLKLFFMNISSINIFLFHLIYMLYIEKEQA
jgi:hypothetical protein